MAVDNVGDSLYHESEKKRKIAQKDPRSLKPHLAPYHCDPYAGPRDMCSGYRRKRVSSARSGYKPVLRYGPQSTRRTGNTCSPSETRPRRRRRHENEKTNIKSWSESGRASAVARNVKLNCNFQGRASYGAGWRGGGGGEGGDEKSFELFNKEHLPSGFQINNKLAERTTAAAAANIVAQKRQIQYCDVIGGDNKRAAVPEAHVDDGA